MKINDQSNMLRSTVSVKQKVVNADGSEENLEGIVVSEHFMDLIVNEKLAAKLVCTPSNLAELAAGRLMTEGIIAGGEDVESIYICEAGNTAKVFLHKDISLQFEAQPAVRREPTCCTGNRILLGGNRKDHLRRLDGAEWKKEWIFELTRSFAEDSRLHKETKGTHSCYLSCGGRTVFSCEDIGRHNAMDKCIGYAIVQGMNLRECILFTTGRVPTDMVQKAVAAGIPVLVSKAVPTDAAAAMAEKYNLTLICRAWPDSYVIFHEALSGKNV